jgi:hypothetical protein
MNRGALALMLLLTAGLSACSPGSSGGESLTLDPAATRACQMLQQVIADRSALTADQLRERLGDVYNEATSSTNAIVQARAVALYADATVMAGGGEPGSLDSDLDSMQKICSGGGS